MKKIVISLLIVLVLSGGTLWLARYMSGTELDCRSTFEKSKHPVNSSSQEFSVS